jgi:hypothetical protein
MCARAAIRSTIAFSLPEAEAAVTVAMRSGVRVAESSAAAGVATIQAGVVAAAVEAGARAEAARVALALTATEPVPEILEVRAALAAAETAARRVTIPIMEARTITEGLELAAAVAIMEGAAVVALLRRTTAAREVTQVAAAGAGPRMLRRVRRTSRAGREKLQRVTARSS